MLSRALIDFYRCPKEDAEYIPVGDPSPHSGYFTFGEDIICYGRCAGGTPSPFPDDRLHNVAEGRCRQGELSRLPFDPDQLVDNLRLERYVGNMNGNPLRRATGNFARKAYYGVRPLLPMGIRKPIQKAYLRGRQRRHFPRWPVDSSVEAIMGKLLAVNLRAKGAGSIPFVWFWPNGASSCAILTHDVETTSGRDFCVPLMDIDDQYGMKASFQIVPEQRYKIQDHFLQVIRDRGFEINIQDLNHDGRLYSNRAQFLRRAGIINQYGRKYGAHGFRSAVLYRQPDWFDALEFDFDMSIPNSAHMEPQPGGCCSVFPYFIGDILEIPVTTIQDYSLFHILCDYSIDLWRWQLDIILETHGLASFIVHPDYVIERRARSTYTELLKHLALLSSERNVWLAFPGEVNRWWRDRSQMTLIRRNGVWEIEGPGKNLARVAYASLDPAGRIRYTIERSRFERACAPQTTVSVTTIKPR